MRILIALMVVTGVARAADPPRGKELFERRCAGCHALDRDKEGPRLKSVYGRAAGSVSSFKYSDGFKNARITWDADSLNKWLMDPDSVIPNNDMGFRVVSEEERRAIIAYLKAAKD